jgi:hypothetical protein
VESLQASTGLTGTLNPNDPVIQKTRHYLRDGIRPDALTWRAFMDNEYKLRSSELIKNPDNTRAIKFVYVKGRNEVINITVLRI